VVESIIMAKSKWAKRMVSDPQYASWTFGGAPRNFNRSDEIEKQVSTALKNETRSWKRPEKARAFARKMRSHADRIRHEGRTVWNNKSGISTIFISAMCFGVGSGHDRIMIDRYEAAAKSAERFCKRIR
jgi:hypothetical protein